MDDDSQRVAPVGGELDRLPIGRCQASEPRDLVEADEVERIFDAVGRGGLVKKSY